jgi:hypothetical protein
MNESIAPLTKSNSHSLTGPTPQSNVNIAQAKIAILREGEALSGLVDAGSSKNITRPILR